MHGCATAACIDARTWRCAGTAWRMLAACMAFLRSAMLKGKAAESCGRPRARPTDWPRRWVAGASGGPLAARGAPHQPSSEFRQVGQRMEPVAAREYSLRGALVPRCCGRQQCGKRERQQRCGVHHTAAPLRGQVCPCQRLVIQGSRKNPFRCAGGVLHPGGPKGNAGAPGFVSSVSKVYDRRDRSCNLNDW